MQMMRDYFRSFVPWTCGECGNQHIPGTKTTCPKCQAPRDGIPADARQITRIYEGEQAMQAGIEQMTAKGWRVVSQNSYQPRAGAGRIVALGIFAAVVKPPQKFTVIYERA